MATKICSKCKEDKELDLFRTGKRGYLGRRSVCKSCDRAYKAENKEAIKESSKRYYLKNKDHILARCKAYDEKINGKRNPVIKGLPPKLKYPEKYKAVYTVANALTRKKNPLIRPDECSDCGCSCKPQAHHWSYEVENRLDVIWLCIQCHTDLHQNLKLKNKELING